MMNKSHSLANDDKVASDDYSSRDVVRLNETAENSC